MTRQPLEGCRIAVAAPSRQLMTASGEPDFEALEHGLRWLEQAGASVAYWGPVVSDARFAGDDALRARCWMGAAANESVPSDLVLALRGGYGFTRILPMLDWEKLGDSRVPAMGFSDFTAYQVALYTMTGRASWHGPTLSSFSALVKNPDALDQASVAAFFSAVNHAPDAWTGFDWMAEQADVEALRSPASWSAEGLLWGGNLAMISSLVGTSWLEPHKFEGGILYLEDVGESAYRVERMLLQLLDSGILQRQRAVLLGSFTGADRAAAFEGDFTLERALRYVRSRLGGAVPVLTNFPIGHEQTRRAVPFGVIAKLELRGASASVGTVGLGGGAVREGVEKDKNSREVVV